jgi:hypothetical protein
VYHKEAGNVIELVLDDDFRCAVIFVATNVQFPVKGRNIPLDLLLAPYIKRML